jgi:ribonuclease HII
MTIPNIPLPCLPVPEGPLCGVDEVGRGPLCGPVVAAAVVLDAKACGIEGLRDSKRLSALQRERLAEHIRARSLGWALGEASPEEIDRLNILQATFLAMRRAVDALPAGLPLSEIWVDGNRTPVFGRLGVPVRAVIKGDALVCAISAASILAKTTRDAWMCSLDAQYPDYGFAKHKGYPTKAHLTALRLHGVLPFYRNSFGPVAALLSSAPLDSERLF